MRKSNLFGGALLLATLFVNTSCKEVFANLDLSGDTTVSSYVTVDAKSKTLAPGDEFTLTVSKIGDGTISWSSSNPDVAEVQGVGANAKIIAKKLGDATITVNVAAATNYQAGSAKCDLKVRITDNDVLAAEIAKGTTDLLLAGNTSFIINDETGLNLSGKEYTIRTDERDVPATIKVNYGITINNNFKLQNVNIEGSEQENPFIIVKDVTTAKVLKADETESDYRPLNNILIDGVQFKGLRRSIIENQSGKILFKKITVENSIVGLSGSKPVFALASGYPESFEIESSTFWGTGDNGHKGFFFQAHGKAIDINSSYKTSWSVNKSTLYRVAVGKKANNTNVFKGKNYLVMNLSNSILVDFGSSSGDEVNGWLFGQNSTTPTITYSKNTYWSAATSGSVVAGWTDSSKEGSDQTGTSIASDPQFNDAANGDFTISGADQISAEIGDPRWITR